jgi:starch phosphorylase
MKECIAFFSMEMAIENLPTYAGGLGILSGAIMLSSDDLNFPMVGITLVNRKGYAEHKIENGEIIDLEEPYEPEKVFKNIGKTFKIDLKDFPVWFTAWKYKLKRNHIILIDTNVEENPGWLRGLTDRLYVENSIDERILKEIILGVGGVELLENLGYKIKKYHLNESHSGFVAIELFKRSGDLEKLKQKIVFTTHTTQPYGHERFPYGIVEKYYEIPNEIKTISPEELNLSRILFSIASFTNAVSWKHSIVVRKLFPEVRDINYITNGVYHLKWVCEELAKLYDEFIPNWREEPSNFVYARNIPLDRLEAVKKSVKKIFIDWVNENCIINEKFNEEDIIISIKRRITGYKRINLVFSDLERLEKLSKEFNLQIAIGGVTHPSDLEGKNVIKKLIDIQSVLRFTKLAFFPKRDIPSERLFVSSADIFLHTPLPPFEACGTSWMRAGMNAVPTLASRDGGVIEVIIDNHNGWLFGENRIDPTAQHNTEKDKKEFYTKLEHALKLYVKNKNDYLNICLNALKTIGSLYNSYRMVREYISKAYI